MDPREYPVQLPVSSWGHILDEHPEFGALDPEGLKIGFEQPTFISQDVQDNDVQNYYRRGLHPQFPDKWFKGVVRLDNTWSGVVTTSYITSALSSSEKVVWHSPLKKH